MCRALRLAEFRLLRPKQCLLGGTTSGGEEKEMKNTKLPISSTEFLAAAAALAAGTQAYSDVVIFQNDAGFDWTFNTLDITRPADMQDSTPGTPSSIYMYYFSDYYGGYGYGSFFYQRTDAYFGGADVWSAGFSDNYAAPLDAGTLIGPSLTDGAFNGATRFEFYSQSCDQYYNCTIDYRGILPEGELTYLGVRFDQGAGTQYGWIGVTRNGVFLDVSSWAYETEVGVAIAAGVPAPGTLAALAFGGIIAPSRKRKN